MKHFILEFQENTVQKYKKKKRKTEIVQILLGVRTFHKKKQRNATER